MPLEALMNYVTRRKVEEHCYLTHLPLLQHHSYQLNLSSLSLKQHTLTNNKNSDESWTSQARTKKQTDRNSWRNQNIGIVGEIALLDCDILIKWQQTCGLQRRHKLRLHSGLR